MSNVAEGSAPNNVGIYHRSVHSGKWILASNIAQKALSIITFFVLARLLAPSDYGLMAVIFLVTGFFDTFSTPGFEKALMQRGGEADEHLDIIWTFNFFKGLLIAALVYFATPLIVRFFNAEASLNLIRAGAIFVFLPVLTNSRQFYFFRELDFKKIFWRDLSGQLAYIIVAFAYVFGVGHTVWALFFGQVARFSASIITTYILHPYRPRFSFKFKKLLDLTRYGSWITGQNILDYFLGMLDSLYIGRLLPAEQLGYYTKARDLAFMPVSPFFTIIDKVGFAAYAKLQDQQQKIQEGFLRTFDVLMSVTIPVFILLATEGGLLVNVVLGKKWLGMIPPLKILAAATILSSLVSITKPLFDAVGRPDINVKSHVIQFVFLIGALYFGIERFGLVGVGMALFFSWLVVLVFVVSRARSVVRLGKETFYDSVAALLVANGLMAAILVPWRLMVQPHVSSAWLSLGVVALAGLVYMGALYLVGKNKKRGPWPTFRSILSSLLPKAV